ncbi:hypothetical protein GGS23DRAFT_479221 [Durotheca rogersii]|uniref:uncharacterized protein n=1 Tax=Durotheca rogersii TaxID=419775 RepID=UPI002220921C|nr:uncharacterized protein GGS23DRAFT_479221 [Durotheca rogersii]KAI5864021.1 hypothetical protein GGS23DRAFT_479221 [Durotheca rogersii]
MKDGLKTSASFEFFDYRTSQPPPPPYPGKGHDDGDDGLSVKTDAFWSYCGPLLSQSDDLPPSLDEWAAAALSTSLLPVLLPFLAFANDLLAKNGLHHYWLTIRATKATAEFDKPRWHADDLFFANGPSGGLRAPLAPPPPSSSKGSGGRIPRILMRRKSQKPALALQTDWKLCATLLGPSTQFIPAEHQAAARATSRAARRALATDHACTSVRCVGCASAADAVRERLATELEPLGRVEAGAGACAVFRIGQDRGAVHSEPRMSGGDRVFVNVVPGRREELAGLVAKWGMGFPRSWWVAPGVLRGHELT